MIRVGEALMEIMKYLGLMALACALGYIFGTANQKRSLRPNWGMVEKLAPDFEKRLSVLLNSLKSLTNRTVMTSTPADRIVFAFAQIAVEDFLEILVLCRAGYGIGALKSLRSLYEHAVTQSYISKEPAEAERFLDYHPINQGKVLNQARELGQLEMFGLSSVQLADIDEAYREAKGHYQETACKKCKTTRTQISWSKLSLVEMARKADKFLHDMCTALYLFPTFHTHATVPAVLSRVQLGEHAGFKSNIEAQSEHVTSALIGGHNLILKVFDTTNTHFSLGMNSELEERVDDFHKAWPKLNE